MERAHVTLSSHSQELCFCYLLTLCIISNAYKNYNSQNAQNYGKMFVHFAERVLLDKKC